MENFKKEDLKEFLYFKSLKNASGDDVIRMQMFTQKFINPKCNICKTCSAQIRFAYNTILNWGAKNNVEKYVFQELSETVEFKEVTDNQEFISDINDVGNEKEGDVKDLDEMGNKYEVGEPKTLCECGTELPDKRYKKCKKCKRNKNK